MLSYKAIQNNEYNFLKLKTKQFTVECLNLSHTFFYLIYFQFQFNLVLINLV